VVTGYKTADFIWLNLVLQWNLSKPKNLPKPDRPYSPIYNHWHNGPV
jgi:hypothetical protein